MIKALTHVTLLVHDIDETVAFYTQKLGFVVRDNEEFDGMRWVTISTKEQPELKFALMPAADAEEEADCCGSCDDNEEECVVEDMSDLVGMQGVFFLSTDDCAKTCQELKAKGVEVLNEPEMLPWGMQATFVDLYGNSFCLIEPKKS